jgi:hypothetical protein
MVSGYEEEFFSDHFSSKFSLGWATNAAGFHFGGMLSKTEGIAFADVPSGVAAISKVPALGWAQIFAFCGALELAGFKQAEGSFTGDFTASSFPVGYVGAQGPEDELELRAKELNQGRAAMMGCELKF